MKLSQPLPPHMPHGCSPLTEPALEYWQRLRKDCNMGRSCVIITAGCRLKVTWSLARASDYWIAVTNPMGVTLYHPGVIYFAGHGFCVNARLVDII